MWAPFLIIKRIYILFLIVSGDDGVVDTPVPIPNTEVKHYSADDSTMCESRTLPGEDPYGSFFCIVFIKYGKILLKQCYL